MTAILGISAFYHDSAAALVVDGDIVAAAQEERFTRKKHDPGYPTHAAQYCLREAGLTLKDIDYFAFYEKPLTKFERLLETYLAFAPSGFLSFRMAMPVWLKEKLFMRRTIRGHLPEARGKLLFLDHHESHAASAFFPSPFAEAAILTLDGVGEWSTTTLGVGSGNRIELKQHLQFPHSLGLLYSAFTYYCGFKVNSGEYKLMGLAPYGKPVYADLIYRHLIDLKADGSFWLDMTYFNYCQGLTMTNGRFDGLFGGKPRPAESQLEQRHMDLAASIQAVTEEVMLRLGRTVHQAVASGQWSVASKNASKNLVLAGGVALNCVANGRLLREGPFENIWIQPAAGDAGGALGAALFVWHQLLEKPRTPNLVDSQKGSFLGPAFTSEDVRRFLEQQKVTFHHLPDRGADLKSARLDTGRFEIGPTTSDLFEYVAQLLADGKVVGWFQGRMEFGPRALGGRSILGDPRSAQMQANMNVKIKFRESFRPFAPIVLAEKASAWFDIQPGQESPYMLLVAPVKSEHRLPIPPEQQEILRSDPDLCKRVNVVRSSIPAVTHVDFSARLQTVDAERNPRLHRLLSAFDRLTGCPVLVNTSFNVRGEPIVCTPAEAFRCFRATNMDVLVLEDCVILKEELATPLGQEESQAYVGQFQLD